ncbi:dynein regulatory complex protein 9 isoform X1 [Crotalus tigris]|uniref:dynein regulatory complex protein 9 isoform X1 n=1 Tax=Crotalus tigris TaxID=88082 RepID=UPI00192F1CAE|nr:dynein regulatory complex protein 9 isoform X1 [Crotalus tigris]
MSPPCSLTPREVFGALGVLKGRPKIHRDLHSRLNLGQGPFGRFLVTMATPSFLRRESVESWNWIKNTTPKLPPLDAIRLSAVLEDCTDQLTILGCIMPVSYEGRKDVEDLDEQGMQDILTSQQELSAKYRNLMDKRAESLAKIPVELGKVAEIRWQLLDTSSDLKRSNHLFTMATRQSVLSTDVLQKVQADRQYSSNVLEGTMDEMLMLRTFRTLQLAVTMERDKKTNLQNLVLREEMGRKKIKSLQKQLGEVKKEKDYELQNRNEMIAYLKDQLQEMKAKTDMENRYVKKDTDLHVAQVQKKCSLTENDLQNEIEKLRNEMDQEIRVHMEIEAFLKQQQTSIEEKLEYWMEKYEKETEAKQQALNNLKSSRTADQASLQELAKQCRACELAIIEDRKEKENARKKVEQDALEMKSILKLQAWWRGMMVRRFLGPYRNLKKMLEEEPVSKEKGKKGKAGPKKKK